MARTSDKRERLVESAKDLIHEHGYNQTTLADIAEAAGVPLGNVYYYFTTKEEIATAVIDERVQEICAKLRTWDELPDPRQRLIRFVDMVARQRDTLATSGCAVGSLCQELNKERSSLSEKADGILKTQLKWMTTQFRLLGKRDATDLGHELMAMLQGISLLANALNNPNVVDRQVRRLKGWLRAL
jgi:AcrR family transcriptional regulator